jgi:hypothetical protein
MKRLIAAAIGLALMASLLVAAAAPPSLVLLQEQTQETDPNGTRPDYCWNEDDRHFRLWRGSLAAGETFTVTEQFCDLTLDGINAGGVGVRFTVWSKGLASTTIHQPAPQDHEINWPLPVYPYPDVPGMEFLRRKGQTITSACIVPAYSESSEHGTGNLVGGVYTLTFVNDSGRTLRDLRIEVEVRMARPGWQEGWCPVPYQNITP